MTEPPEDQPDISGGSVWDMEEPPTTESQAAQESIQISQPGEQAKESLKESPKELIKKEPPKKTQKKPTKEPSLSLTKAEEKPKQTLKSQEKKIEKSDSWQKTTEKQDAAEQQNQPEKIKEKQAEPPKTKSQARPEPQQNENPTATVIDKNGKKKSKKDKRKNQQQRQEPEIKQEPPKIIPMEQPPKEIELPADFGIVMEPEEPEPIELPDPNENNRNILMRYLIRTATTGMTQTFKMPAGPSAGKKKRRYRYKKNTNGSCRIRTLHLHRSFYSAALPCAPV